MPTRIPARLSDAEPAGFRITGRFVLFTLIAFFGTVIGVNIIMARFAVSTFGGVETESSYKAGLTFKAEEEAARAQAARGWKVDADVRYPAQGTAEIRVELHDRDGQPIAGLAPDVRLLHPTDARNDHSLALAETAPGIFVGATQANAGQWNLRLDFSRDGERMFRSTSRIILK
ncbi:FixH family protein [Terrihabitans sp. B22-R8]|uniref:FixH family protein n=1 Tax=Terrihabitans sp. B22-R8 TaxID=3425128 RepID=UPI00403C1CC1